MNQTPNLPDSATQQPTKAPKSDKTSAQPRNKPHKMTNFSKTANFSENPADLEKLVATPAAAAATPAAPSTAAAAPSTAATAADQIAPQIGATIAQLPNSSGVYMYYQGEKLLYVGKAKSLKNRVRSYFAFSPQLRPSPRVSQRIAHMLYLASELRFISTPSELDALVLENSLIKQLHPRYNILLRDDKTYPYICIDTSAPFARPELVRKIRRGSQYRYFGPYATGAKALLEAIFTHFKLRQKASCKKRCLFAQIGRCLAPCEIASGQSSSVQSNSAKSLANAYATELSGAIKALKNPTLLLDKLREQMAQLAAAERFEQAASVRDNIAAIERLSSANCSLDLARSASFDAIALRSDPRECSAIRLVVEAGKVISIISEKSAVDADAAEFLRAFILAQYKQLAPRIIYLEREHPDAPLLEQLLYERSGRKCHIRAAKSADVRRLLAAAKTAAQPQQPGATAPSVLQSLASRFGLMHIPQRIEVFDNSMMQGSAIVGAMVCYDGGWHKAGYRKYLLDASSDYEQMRQMLSRRIARFSELAAPDLWVIDGGQALANLAQQLLACAGANVDVIAISKEKHNHLAYRAKGAARDLLYAQGQVHALAPSDRLLQFIQMLRDEAHRFAISAHRSLKRRQDLQASELARAGISAASVAKLIKYFGTFDAIMAASSEEIQSASNATVARKLELYKSQQSH